MKHSDRVYLWSKMEVASLSLLILASLLSGPLVSSSVPFLTVTPRPLLPAAPPPPLPPFPRCQALS